MATALQLNLKQLLDLSLGSSEFGHFNYNLLHSFLHAVLLHLNLSSVKVDYRGGNEEQIKKALDKNSKTRGDVIFLDSVRTDPDRNSIEQMIDTVNLSKRTSALEIQMDKLTSFLDKLNIQTPNQVDHKMQEEQRNEIPVGEKQNTIVSAADKGMESDQKNREKLETKEDRATPKADGVKNDATDLIKISSIGKQGSTTNDNHGATPVLLSNETEKTVAESSTKDNRGTTNDNQESSNIDNHGSLTNDNQGSSTNDNQGSSPNDNQGSSPNDSHGSSTKDNRESSATPFANDTEKTLQETVAESTTNDNRGSSTNDKNGSSPNDNHGSSPNDNHGTSPNDNQESSPTPLSNDAEKALKETVAEDEQKTDVPKPNNDTSTNESKSTPDPAIKASSNIHKVTAGGKKQRNLTENDDKVDEAAKINNQNSTEENKETLSIPSINENHSEPIVVPNNSRIDKIEREIVKGGGKSTPSNVIPHNEPTSNLHSKSSDPTLTNNDSSKMLHLIYERLESDHSHLSTKNYERILEYIEQHFSKSGGLITGEQYKKTEKNVRRQITKFKSRIFERLITMEIDVCRLHKVVKRLNDTVEDLIDTTERESKSLAKLAEEFVCLSVRVDKLNDCVGLLNDNCTMMLPEIEALREGNKYLQMVKLDREEFELELHKNSLIVAAKTSNTKFNEFQNEVSSFVSHVRDERSRIETSFEKMFGELRELIDRKTEKTDFETIQMEFNVKWNLTERSLKKLTLLRREEDHEGTKSGQKCPEIDRRCCGSFPTRESEKHREIAPKIVDLTENFFPRPQKPCLTKMKGKEKVCTQRL